MTFFNHIFLRKLLISVFCCFFGGFNSFVYFILSFYYYNIYCVIFYETDMLELACYLRLLLGYEIMVDLATKVKMKRFSQ